MWKKMMLAAVALLGIAGAASAEEPCNTVQPSAYVNPYAQQVDYRYGRENPYMQNPYVRYERGREDYQRLRERQRWEQMRRFRWEREHRYGRRW